MFSLLVVLYLFLAGCGGGLLLVSSLISLVFYRSSARTGGETRDFTSLRNRSFLVGFIIVSLAAFCLVVDLGRPDRLLFLFIRPTQTVLSFGAYVVLITVSVVLFLLIINYLSIPRLGSRVKKTVEVLCVLLSFLLVVYAGVYLQEMKSIPFWDTLAVPVLFVLSSLSAGLALFGMIGSLANGRKRMWGIINRLQRSQLVVLVSEALVLVLFLWVSTFNSTATRSLALLFGDDLLPWFIGAVGLGIVLPLVQSIIAVSVRKMPGLAVLDLMGICGGFCLRYCIIYAGVY